MEITQISGDVQREAVRSYPAADVDADGGDLTIAHPYSGKFGNALRFDSVIGERLNNRLPDAANVCADVALPIAQIEDGVTDQLTGTVIRHVAAAVRRIERYARAR